MVTKMRNGLLAAVLTAAGMAAQAMPVQFTYTSTVFSSDIAGVAVGDTVTVTVLADNGGTSLNSQDWATSTLISGSLQAGSYTQNYVDGWYSAPSWIAFRTDGSGTLITTDFVGTTYSPNHTDSFGTGPFVYLYNGAFLDYYGNIARMNDGLQVTANWTVSAVTPIPEPSTLALVALGLGLITLVRRQRG